MNWWDILKVQQTLDVGQQPVWQQGQKQFDWPQQSTIQNVNTTGQQIQTGEQSQLYPTQQTFGGQYVNPSQLQTPTLTKPQVQTGQQGQPILDQYNQAQTIQYKPERVEGEVIDQPTDDTDVGSIRENVDRAKQNLTQLPRGPKAVQLTQVLTDLSAAAIDPVNQKNIAVAAKKKLHQAFPQMG
jgi:hypothetical protein